MSWNLLKSVTDIELKIRQTWGENLLMGTKVFAKILQPSKLLSKIFRRI